MGTINSDTKSKSAVDEQKDILKQAESIISKKYGDNKNSPAAQKEMKELIAAMTKYGQDIRKDQAERKADAKLERQEAAKARKEAYNILLEAAKKARDETAKGSAERKAIEKEINALAREEAVAQAKEAAAALGDAVKDAAKLFVSNVGAGMDSYASTFSQYKSQIDTRLQGADTTFKSLEKLVRRNLAASPYLKQEKMLESLNSLIEKGVAYNIEQRAYLQAMQDKLVTTFDAFDSNLLRIIRLQQADSTVARMGMEGALTRFLNSMFQDTYYLSNVYDNVSQSIFELTSQLGRDASVEVEYVLQKWLGSMSAVGVSDDTLVTIASMINALGTGDVSTLSGNTGMQNLIVTAANRSGNSYSGILTQGLNASTLDELMSGIVQYIQEIGAAGNLVVRKQYAELFGVALSDMTALMSLQAQDIKNISQNMLDYSTAIQETHKLLSTVGSRMHLKTMIDNIFDNILSTTIGGIASNGAAYLLFKTVDMIESITGGYEIPGISVMGNMIDLHATAEGLIKNTMVYGSLLAQVPAMLAGLFNGGGTDLSIWAGSEYTKRGLGFVAVSKGYTSETTSGAAYMGSGSGEDIKEASVASASESGKEEIKSSENDPDSQAALLKRIVKMLAGGEDDEEPALIKLVGIDEATLLRLLLSLPSTFYRADPSTSV